MSRIPLIDPETAPPETRAIFDQLNADGLGVFNVMRMFANKADFLAALRHIVHGLYIDAKLAPRYRELAYLRASQINSCHY
jgi:alkylhydroperoxidase family enzyme